MLQIDTVWQPSTQQQQYRQLLEAMSRPGLVGEISAQGSSAYKALSLLATLVDAQVAIADSEQVLTEDDWRMLQATSATVNHADFVLADGMGCLSETPKLGTLPNPEQSATIVLTVAAIGQGALSLRLSGPGIKEIHSLEVGGLDERWLQNRDGWNASFPLGVDMLLSDGRRFVALPRTTHVEVL